MKRDLLINVLLIIAGILLAFVLFGAGAMWKGKTQPRRSVLSSAPAAEKEQRQANEKRNSEEAITKTRPQRPTPP